MASLSSTRPPSRTTAKLRMFAAEGFNLHLKCILLIEHRPVNNGEAFPRAIRPNVEQKCN